MTGVISSNEPVLSLRILSIALVNNAFGYQVLQKGKQTYQHNVTAALLALEPVYHTDLPCDG